jgi:citrate synthase
MISGLDDVVVAETVLSDVDGQAGRLVIRGHSLDDLVDHASFESVVTLLWGGFFDDLPEREERTEPPDEVSVRRGELPGNVGALSSADAIRAHHLDIRGSLGVARQRVFAHLNSIDAQLLQLPLFDAVRSLVARLDDGDDINTALALVAAPAVFTPGILRLQKGLAPIPPDPTLGHAADILRMLHGDPVAPECPAALDRYLVTASDHGLNASTFVARIVASTRAGLTSATVAAMSALKGPLHGGAPGPVLDMLDNVGSAENASSWLEGALARGDRLMGFGHRVYRVRDPRADALKEAVRTLASSGQTNAGGRANPSRLKLAEAVEAAALDLLARKKPDRPLQTNTEFYTALLLEAVGLPREAFTCAFAAGRSAGWIAHAREQMLNGRLIRPQSRYVGPRPEAQAAQRTEQQLSCSA